MNQFMKLAPGIVFSLIAAGCAQSPICCNGGYEYRHAGQVVEPPKPDERDAKIVALEQERQRQAETLAEMQRHLQDLEQQLATQEREVQPIAPVVQAQRGLVRALRPEIEKGDITVDLNSERLLIQLASVYLFESGETALKPAGTDALNRIGGILKDYPEYNVEVAGHTDNVPIGPKLLPKFASNEALSTARAKEAARVLHDSGVDPSTLKVRGYGPTQPLTPNTSEDGRHKNRRVEIRVTRKG